MLRRRLGRRPVQRPIQRPIRRPIRRAKRGPSASNATCAIATYTLFVCAISTLVFSGCSSSRPIGHGINFSALAPKQPVSTPAEEKESPLDQARSHSELSEDFWAAPITTADDWSSQQVELSLDEILHLALSDAKILKSLNAAVLVNPASATGIYDPAITVTDPLFGVEAALSQFDTNFAASINHANNDDVFNNSILGGGATEVVQDLLSADFSLRKVGATGAQYTLRKNLVYDNNNNVSSTFPSSYAGFIEAQFRQPLLQGRGVEFNRIAGPNATPGFRSTSGVVISQINHDVSIAQFNQDVREYVNEIVTAYWELQFAYQNYEAAKEARDAVQATWESVKAKFDNDLPGGEADREAQSREQYFRFQQELVTALNGDSRTQTTGVFQAEANLRRLLGLPQSDGVIIRPADEPASAQTVFDWNSLVFQALGSRIELKQQVWQIKIRELELLASKNFTKPRLDAVATMRNNGFGDDLTGGSGRFSSVVRDMASGDHNEWEMGLQLNVPIGFRQASAGVRNSELKLLRERAILIEQEKQIVHDLGSAVRQSQQYYEVMQLAFNRMNAARDMRDARRAAFEADAVTLDLLLDAEQRFAISQQDYHRARANFQLSNESVNRESGQLLTSHQVHLSPSNPQCTTTCAPQSNRRARNGSIDYRF